MIFYKSVNDLSEKIIKISEDEKLRKKIARNGKIKYMKYFNSDLVSEFIIDKTLDIKSNKIESIEIPSKVSSGFHSIFFKH